MERTAEQPLDPRVAKLVADALRRVRFGEIRLVVVDGEVTEIDSTERKRVER